MAAGLTLDEALEEMLGSLAAAEEVEGTGDFNQIEKQTNFDLILVKDEEHLHDILRTKTLEEWRIFLHPYQKKFVEWETNGPMNITGAAGTGKTVALMHRAVHLAKKLENPTDKVLVTTFTTNLPITIRKQIQDLNHLASGEEKGYN